MHTSTVIDKITCLHCGEECPGEPIVRSGHQFCCDGCGMVYELLNQSGLCDYYQLNEQPGINLRKKVREDKFAFLEDNAIREKLISFSDDDVTHVTFYLPQIHCSSCLYLLENLHRLHQPVVHARVNFAEKKVEIIFHHQQTSLRKIAELLTSIGYEPYISLHDLKEARPAVEKKLIYQLGIAGFGFANIMLLSFPEYLGLETSEMSLQQAFRMICFTLALPVFFYSAQPFFISGWKGLKHKFLNIDAPIALAVLVTFGRSVYEVITGEGSGYFDSMSGIVFFMLAGRIAQDKTHKHLSFERDFSSYFPIAITAVQNGIQIPVALPDVKTGDTLLIHNEELIPADGILTRGRAFIDYSFVTGESQPVRKEMGEIIYAGGKQKGQPIEMLTIKEVNQSYLTSLWSRDDDKKKDNSNERSFVHFLSRYFTYILLTIAAGTALYWHFTDPGKMWDAITAVMIVACPCALLLSNTFTNGNILRILSNNKLYLRNAQVIEDIGNIDHIVFDKTGTLTQTGASKVSYSGKELSAEQLAYVIAIAAQSTHPLSKAIVRAYGNKKRFSITDFAEHPGKGIEGFVNGTRIRLGSYAFLSRSIITENHDSIVAVAIDDQFYGSFSIESLYRQSVQTLIKQIPARYKISVISGDHDKDKDLLKSLFGERAEIKFNQTPEDKLLFIRDRQQKGDSVMMIGDGLNDAVALKQSNVGVALTENNNNFTPASDAILDAAELGKLFSFVRLCQLNKNVVIASFIISILYNIVGLYFAVTANLSPLVAAILMPASSLSILLVTYGASSVFARLKGLFVHQPSEA